MELRKGKLTLEGLKVVLILAIFFCLEDQIVSLRSELVGDSGNVADALGRGRDEFTEGRRALIEALETSRAELISIRKELSDSAQQLASDRAELRKVIAERDREVIESLTGKIVRYRDSVVSTEDRSQENETRIESVEDQVRLMLPGDPESMERAMMYPTIQLKGNKTVGSGVIVYSQPREAGAEEESAEGEQVSHTTFALTAYHVVKEILADEFPSGRLENVHLLDDKNVPSVKVVSAEVEIYDAERDLALLRLRSREKFAHVATLLPSAELDRLNLFTRVYAVGCPLGNNPLPTCGEISSKTKAFGGQVFWMVTAPTFFGNSGGGIFLSENCQLIGISSMIYTYTYGLNRSMVVPHMGLFVPISTVYDWLKERNYAFLVDQKPEPTAEPVDTAALEAAAHPVAEPQPADAAD